MNSVSNVAAGSSAGTATETSTTPSAVAVSVSAALAENSQPHDDTEEYAGESVATVGIALDGDSIAVDGPGVTLDGSTATITSAGTYRISGALADGQIVVDTADAEAVRLILKSVDITSATSAPINVVDAEEVVIELADGTENYISDGASYVFADPADNEEDPTQGYIAIANGVVDITAGGGAIQVKAAGDGIDVNGAIEMIGGLVVVNGPTENMNGALDYDASFTISGGYLVAAGSAGMAQAPSASSGQYALLLNFPSALPAGALIHIRTDEGDELMTFAPEKTFQSIAFSSPALAKGTTVEIYYGGSSTGTVDGGLYQGGTYTRGEEIASLTISDVVTVIVCKAEILRRASG